MGKIKNFPYASNKTMASHDLPSKDNVRNACFLTSFLIKWLTKADSNYIL